MAKPARQWLWDEETEDAARELVAEGLSYRQIARILTSRFKRPFTRNAVLGKAHRGNWSLPNAPLAAKGPKLPRIKIAREVRRKAPQVAPATPEGAQIVAFPGTDHPYRQSSRGLEIPPAHLCHWIYGEVPKGDAVYCARPVDPALAALERPYCAEHWRAMTDPSGRRPFHKRRAGAHMDELIGEFR